MAGQAIPFNGRINQPLPFLPFIVDQQGYLIGYEHMNGTITVLPACGWDNNLTAFAGGGQTGVNLNYRNSRITTVATAADSVTLPQAVVGMEMTIVNAAAANAMAVFPATGDAINALAANASLSIAANKAVTFYCSNAGQWHSILTA